MSEEDLKLVVRDLERITGTTSNPAQISLRELMHAVLQWAFATAAAAPSTGYEHQSKVGW
jgi:hypothetical protein